MQDGVPCSNCGGRVLKAEGAVFNYTGSRIGMIVEGDPNSPTGRRVESRPASGGTADSSVAADGAFQASLSGPLDLGRKGERRVIKTLCNKLRERGADVHVEDDARDDFGEDAILVIDGRRTPVQIVTVPNKAPIWKDLNVNKTVTLSGDLQGAVSILRDAVVAKSVKGKATILALDVAHIGAIVNRALVDAYLTAFGDPVAEFSFGAVWLVVPTPRSTIELR